MHRSLLQVVALITILVASPARGQGITQILAPVHEIAGRQSMGIGAALFGDHGFLGKARHSVVVQPYFGFYGYESLFAGIAANYQTAALLPPYDVGISVAAMDADISTTTVGVNLARTVLERGRSLLLFQGAYAYTWSGAEDTAVYLDYTDDPGQPLVDDVLVDEFTVHTLYVHAVYRFALPILQPVLDLGWAGSRYGLDGRECGPNCFEPGALRSRRDTTGGVTFGAGLSLTLGQAIAFGGLRFSDDGGMFLVSLGARF